MPRFASLAPLLGPLLAAALLVPMLGCTSAATKKAAEQQESNLKVVGLLYGRYQGQHRGRSPADEASFREFIEENGAPLLESFGMPPTADVLVSERDQLPYTIVYAGSKPATALDGMRVIAYEQQGLEGKIFASDNLGAVIEIEAGQLSK
jgi:hypothetical protein